MYLFVKRIIDILSSILAIILLLPLFLVISLSIFLQDFHNPIFSHKRIGKNGFLFSFYKIRSMPVNSPNVESHESHKINVTPIGKFIRRSNLDELPQLFCILKGDMSLIGPRPPIPSQKNLIQLRTLNNSIHLRPGLTGWAQVNSYDNIPDFEKASLDGYYFDNISFTLDVKILLMTISYLTKRPPKY